MIHPSSLHEERDSPLPGADLMVGNLPFAEDVETIPLFQDTLSLAVSEELLQKVYGDDWLEMDLILRERATLQACKELPVVEYGLDRHPSRSREPGEMERPVLDDMTMNAYRCQMGLCAAVFPDHYAHELFEREPQIHIYPLEPVRIAFRVGIGIRKGMPRKGMPRKESVKKFAQVALAYFAEEKER